MFEHFIAAQGPVYDDIVAELAAGRKRTHWMWFVFPQLRGLGHSDMAIRFGLADLDEARLYLAHPTLGPRLVACTELMLRHAGRSATDILGSPDDLKFCSSMTLFARAGADRGVFGAAINRFYSGIEDEKTLALLARAA
jgi:uncharacterized protein (DUF1810 family)